MLKVRCTITSSLSDKTNKRMAIENIGDKVTKSESVVIKIEAFEGNEWRVQDMLIVDGGDLITAVQRTMNC